MDNELLAALRNIIYKMVSDPKIASLCLQETKQFREGSDSFGVPSAVVSKKQMNPTEWWIYFGMSAKNLRYVAVRIFSQTVSTSGCERNWSTFALIYSKRLNDLVYVYYNLRLRLKCIQKKVQLKYIDPTLDDYVDEDDDPIIGCLAGQQQEPELDEPGSPPRPASVVAREIRVDPE
ncbi:uncharacterized protein [Elaeis guineensis]|uniref:uncharacterized protein n=1 Tax=Elaeis guineensis var. tenera TaxID=51953 RepID=UPI003C6D233C